MIKKNLSIITAMGPGNIIGYGDNLPWRCPEDMAYFKEVTMGHNVVMGRKTWLSIPKKFRPLEGRKNYVLSRSLTWDDNDAEHIDFSGVFWSLAEKEKTFIIGGSEIYSLFVPYAHEILITKIPERLVNRKLEGDPVYFMQGSPEFNYDTIPSQESKRYKQELIKSEKDIEFLRFTSI